MNNKYIQSGLHVEKSKFGLSKKTTDEALDLFGERGLEIYEDFIGMCLTRTQNKALLAVQGILNTRLPVANHKAESTDFPSRLKFSLPEYYDAYGVGKTKTKRGWMEYNVRESKLALKALHSLGSKSHQFYYRRVRWAKDGKGKGKRLTSFRAFIGTLININAGFDDLKDSEVKALREGKWSRTKTEKRVDIDIGLSTIITDQMKEYFVLIPSSLFDDIKAISGNGVGSRSRYIPLFIEWLIVQAELKRRNKDTRIEIKIDELKMARTLRMDYFIKKGMMKEIRRELRQCYDTAHRLGYLSDAIAGRDGIQALTLNIERYRYYAEMIKHTQELWHQKEYKRKKRLEKRLKY